MLHGCLLSCTFVSPHSTVTCLPVPPPPNPLDPQDMDVDDLEAELAELEAEELDNQLLEPAPVPAGVWDIYDSNASQVLHKSMARLV